MFSNVGDRKDEYNIRKEFSSRPLKADDFFADKQKKDIAWGEQREKSIINV